MSKTQPTTAKLSDTQLVILGAAAQRADGSLLPFPQSLTAKGAALNKVVETLCKRKLVEERRTINGAPEWRRDEERRPLGLFITTSGLLALGVDNTEKEKPAQAAASMPRQRKTAAAKPARESSEGVSRQLQGPSGAVAKQAGSGDPDAAAAIRRHHRRHHRQDRLAAAFGARLLQRPREKEAEASPRLGRGQGRRAPLSHRADRILQGVSHGAVIGASPASPEAARAILRPIRARIESLCCRTGSRLAQLLSWRAGRAMARLVGQ